MIYLRVSSDGQVNKAHNPEGYSLPAQREGCERHAAGLGAEVIAEFVEAGYSGTNLRRPALQKMLAELPTLKPTYVIFYDLSRVARDDFDALWLLREIEGHGCKLESTLERTDNTPAGRLLYTIMAGVNAFRSRGDAEKVKLGMARKHADGGTMGRAPIGYMNTTERIEGREVRVIKSDPERAPLVKLGFDAFATGNYSLTSLCEMLDEAGLRTPQTPKTAPAPLSRANVHRMLTNDYYIGVVTWDGVKNPNGRHAAIIDEATFKKIGEVLEAHRLSGERNRKHTHYLKGTIYCGSCGRRLVFSQVRGRGGLYEYFGCLSRPGRGQHCAGRHMQTEDVERAVEHYYRTIHLTRPQREAVRQEVERYAGELAKNAKKESARHAERLRELQRQQQKLLHLHYAGSVDEDVLAAEQDRIKRERAEAHKWANAAVQDFREIKDALKEALALLTDTDIRYEQATPHTRRLLNQALFKALLVLDGEVSEAEPTPWVAAIRALALPAARPAQLAHNAAQTSRGRRRNDHDPLSGAVGLHKTNLVRRAGLEPAPPD
ncbi:MAG: recombinase family protein [Solirubrobacteraceae bacterium]